MQTNEKHEVELIELGSVTADTAGAEGFIPEGFTVMLKGGGITAE